MSQQFGKPPVQQAVYIPNPQHGVVAAQPQMTGQPQVVQPHVVYAQNMQQQSMAGNVAWGNPSQGPYTHQNTVLVGGFTVANQGSAGTIGGVMGSHYQPQSHRTGGVASPPIGAKPGIQRKTLCVHACSMA